MKQEMNDDQRRDLNRRVIRQLDHVINPRSLWMGAAVAFSGTAAAAVNHGVSILMALLCLLFCVVAQIGGNAMYAYHCYKLDNFGHDTDAGLIGRNNANETDNMFMNAVYICMLIAATLGVVMMAQAGWWLIIFGVLTALCMYVYYLGKKPLVHSRWGLLITFLLFGPIGTIGTCYAQLPFAYDRFNEAHFIIPAIYISFIMGFLASGYCAMIYYINWKDDINLMKRGLARVYTRSQMRDIYFVCSMLAAVVIAFMAFSSFPHHYATRVVILVLAIIFAAYRILIYIEIKKENMMISRYFPIVSDIVIGIVTFVIMVIAMYDAYL